MSNALQKRLWHNRGVSPVLSDVFDEAEAFFTWLVERRLEVLTLRSHCGCVRVFVVVTLRNGASEDTSKFFANVLFPKNYPQDEEQRISIRFTRGGTPGHRQIVGLSL